MTAEIELDEVGQRFCRSLVVHLACAHETSERLGDLHVEQVRSVKVVAISKESSLDP